MALKVKPTCDECDKELSSKQSLKNHMLTLHDGLKGIKSLFSSPKPMQQQQQQRRRSNTVESAVQGNSSGQVDNPTESSEGDFLCADCEKKFSSNDAAMNHTCNAHDNTSKVDSTEITDELEIIDREVPIEDDQTAEDVGDVILAEELERFAKLAETLTITGSKCHDCTRLKQIIAHKDTVIRIHGSKLKSTKKRVVNISKERSGLVKETKKMVSSINQLTKELHNSQNSQKLLQIKLNEAFNAVRKQKPAAEHDVETPVISIKCRECDFVGVTEEDIKQHKRDEKAKSKAKAAARVDRQEEGPLTGEQMKCG